MKIKHKFCWKKKTIRHLDITIENAYITADVISHDMQRSFLFKFVETPQEIIFNYDALELREKFAVHLAHYNWVNSAFVNPDICSGCVFEYFLAWGNE